jgi:hypothetical protein
MFSALAAPEPSERGAVLLTLQPSDSDSLGG